MRVSVTSILATTASFLGSPGTTTNPGVTVTTTGQSVQETRPEERVIPPIENPSVLSIMPSDSRRLDDDPSTGTIILNTTAHYISNPGEWGFMVHLFFWTSLLLLMIRCCRSVVCGKKTDPAQSGTRPIAMGRPIDPADSSGPTATGRLIKPATRSTQPTATSRPIKPPTSNKRPDDSV